MPDADLVEAIRAVLAQSPFHGEGHRKVWARLRLRGIRASLRRVLRLMREHALLAPFRAGTPRGPRNHDGTIIPDAVDIMWGTDMTTAWTSEGQAAVFIAIDHHGAECVGIHAARHGTRFEALEPIRQGVRHSYGAFARGIACGLAIRHNHGSQYMSDVFQKELAFLGMKSSPAFVRAPEGNGCAERFFPSLAHPQGKPPVGQDVCLGRGASSGLARIQENHQRHLADRTTQLQTTCSHPQGTASIRGRGGIGSFMVSQQLGAVHERSFTNIKNRD
jgi:transposase InsO family protein